MDNKSSPNEHPPQSDIQPTSSEEGKKEAKSSEDSVPQVQKENLLKRTWNAIEKESMTLQLMFKGALAPTIAIAIYQSSRIAEIYSTVGYLVAIMSILSMPIMPRAKFMMTMLLNIVFICVGTCIALLACYCTVQARKHTTPATATNPGGPTPPESRVVPYNSSASAVSAIWLLANIYVVNAMRASRPQLQLPVIMYSIFAMVSSTYAPAFPTMPLAINFVKRLLEAFLLGFAISFGVSMFVFPKTCRGIFFLQAKGLIKVMQGILAAQKGYVESLETADIFTSGEYTIVDVPDKGKAHFFRKATKQTKVPVNPANAKLKALIAVAGDLQGKIYGDMSFAKRELGFGKLDANDIEKIHHHFQEIMLPLLGMSSTADIFMRVAKQHNWSGAESSEHIDKNDDVFPDKAERVKQWNHVMERLHEPFEVMTKAMTEGLQHVLYALELEKPSKAEKKKWKTSESKPNGTGQSTDVEADAGIARPGDSKFSQHIRKAVDEFYANRKSTLKAFMGQKDVGDLDELASPLQALLKYHKNIETGAAVTPEQKIAQRQLYMILYMEFLLWSAGQAVLGFVEWADEKVEQGIMKRRRIINPGGRRLKKWLISITKPEDMASTEHTPDATESGGAGIYAGASFEGKKDPEHLPPATAWEKSTDCLRVISQSLGSSASGFGLRVAAATFTLGIVAYLEHTQAFFRTQRLVWAMIMVAIGMTTTAGAGVYGFVGRVLGTFLAMCTSLIIWYIVDGHTAGVIVFLFLFSFFEFYVILKYPRLTVIAVLSIVTQVLIIGYELQVQQVGLKAATSSGQPYYPTSELAPYRLATVVAGVFVAFIWTFFPFPLTERSQLRKDLGGALHLLANYYSIVHTSICVRLQGVEGDLADKKSPGHKLESARRQVWDKEMALVTSLRQHASFSSWEPTFGGRFPKETYDGIIDNISSTLSYLALISYASASFGRLHNNPSTNKNDDNSTWFDDFARLVNNVSPTTQAFTSTLALLSGALANGTPLPPYLKLPEGYELSARLETVDKDVLNIKHVQEPGYAAFAVMQVASSLVRDDLAQLIERIKSLVGEVDFSFHIHSSTTSSEETLWEKASLSTKNKTDEEKAGKQN